MLWTTEIHCGSRMICGQFVMVLAGSIAVLSLVPSSDCYLSIFDVRSSAVVPVFLLFIYWRPRQICVTTAVRGVVAPVLFAVSADCCVCFVFVSAFFSADRRGCRGDWKRKIDADSTVFVRGRDYRRRHWLERGRTDRVSLFFLCAALPNDTVTYQCVTLHAQKWLRRLHIFLYYWYSK